MIERVLLAENEQFWFYDVREDGESFGCDLVPKDGNKPYADATDATDEWAEWVAAVESANTQ